jgi:hypothetical protein
MYTFSDKYACSGIKEWKLVENWHADTEFIGLFSLFWLYENTLKCISLCYAPLSFAYEFYFVYFLCYEYYGARNKITDSEKLFKTIKKEKFSRKEFLASRLTQKRYATLVSCLRLIFSYLYFWRPPSPPVQSEDVKRRDNKGHIFLENRQLSPSVRPVLYDHCKASRREVLRRK